MDSDQAYREKTRWRLHNYATSYIKQILEVTSPKIAAIWPPTSYLFNHPNKMD